MNFSWSSDPGLGSQHKEGTDLLDWVQRKAVKMIRSQAPSFAKKGWEWVEGKDQFEGDSLPNAESSGCAFFFFCWLTFNFDLQGLFLKYCFTASNPLSCTGIWHYSSTSVRLHISLSWIFEVPAGSLPACWILQAQPCGASTILHSFVSSTNFLKMCFVPLRTLITFFFFNTFSPFILQTDRRLELQNP